MTESYVTLIDMTLLVNKQRTKKLQMIERLIEYVLITQYLFVHIIMWPSPHLRHDMTFGFYADM